MGKVLQFRPRQELSAGHESIQCGANMIADYLEQDRVQLIQSHPGYDLKPVEDFDEQRYAIGSAGVDDFVAGFRGMVDGSRSDCDESARSEFAYGAFNMGRLVLPNVFMKFDTENKVFDNLVEAGLQQHPETDLPVIAEIVTMRAAASLTLLALWSHFEFSQDERLLLTARICAKTFPPENPSVASAFKYRLREAELFSLLQKPIPIRTDRV